MRGRRQTRAEGLLRIPVTREVTGDRRTRRTSLWANTLRMVKTPQSEGSSPMFMTTRAKVSNDHPRVLVDATAVPENRGGVGRYVGQLLPALAEHGADLAVVCQARDPEHYSKLLPLATVIAAPDGISRRPV